MTDEEKQIEAHIENIKNIRDEVNWRVKFAYTSNVGFVSVLLFVVGLFFNSDYNAIEVLEKQSEIIVIVSLMLSILFSFYVGILNANHLVEKRIELYILKLQKKIYALNQDKAALFSWLGFMYGDKTFKNIYLHIMTQFLGASISFFQYILPNLIALILILFVVFEHPDFIYNYIILFSISLFSCTISMASSAFLGIYVGIVSKKHSLFYNEVIKIYLEKGTKDEQNEEQKQQKGASTDSFFTILKRRLNRKLSQIYNYLKSLFSRKDTAKKNEQNRQKNTSNNKPDTL